MKLYLALKPMPYSRECGEHAVGVCFSDLDQWIPPGFAEVQNRVDLNPETWVQSGDWAFMRRVPPCPLVGYEMVGSNTL
ncbi:MAG: hypothetical protein MN733_10450 [Nitrososphaera sp.]|nr:hypothetical protein [Nitrososphaera sp.]